MALVFQELNPTSSIQQIGVKSRGKIGGYAKKAHRQAKRVVIDATKYPYDDSSVIQQIDKIFWSSDTDFVDEVILVKETQVVGVFRRK